MSVLDAPCKAALRPSDLRLSRPHLRFAVGTAITGRPPIRLAQLRHPACMGLSLSRRHHAISVVLCHSILLFDLRRNHSLVPTAHLHRRRAQRRSGTALLQRRRRLLLPRVSDVKALVGPRMKDARRGKPQWKGRLASKLYAEAQETNGAAAEAQRRVPPPPIPTRGSGDQLDQPDPTWLGELLRGWARQHVLWLLS